MEPTAQDYINALIRQRDDALNRLAVAEAQIEALRRDITAAPDAEVPPNDRA